MLIFPPSDLNLSSKAEAKSLGFLCIEPTEKPSLYGVHCYNDSGPFRDMKMSMDLSSWTRILYEKV
jgi:hypothetical protein